MMNLLKSTLNPLPTLDPTTPWYEFLSYQECCWSLGRPVYITNFMRYNAYLKEIGVIK
jgi:hypothetical protein